MKELETGLDLTEEELLTPAELRLCELNDNELHLFAHTEVETKKAA